MKLLGKVKIYEIAKKLDLTSKEILDLAKQLKIDAKSHLSSIDDKDVARLEEACKKRKKKSKSEKKETKKQEKQPVIIRREVIIANETNKKQETTTKKEEKRNNIGFIERKDNKNFNIVYRNKTKKPMSVSELFGLNKKEEPKEKKEEIRKLLEEQGIDLEQMKQEQNMSEVDDFDFICHVAYDQKPLTRRERADYVKKRDFFGKYSGVARQVLEALLEKYMNVGIYEIEKTAVLKLDPFTKFGTPSKIVKLFGGMDKYMAAVKELEDELYKVA